ncbi:MAG TPA: hypothetical protein VHX64_06995, partial [Caulobacteraceae bacterium]|nr:hypothetical protein [Caulobacteraceae bacterium]
MAMKPKKPKKLTTAQTSTGTEKRGPTQDLLHPRDLQRRELGAHLLVGDPAPIDGLTQPHLAANAFDLL